METQRVVAELNWLKSSGHIADYAIGGAIAAFQWIEPSFTQDLDVFVVFNPDGASSLAPLSKIWPALIDRGAQQVNDHLVIGGWPVQFLGAKAEPLYDEAIANAAEVPFGDVTGRVLTAPYLAAIALAAGRGKDLLRVEEFLSRRVVEKSMLLDLVQRFGLTDSWKTFETRFLSAHG